MKFTNIMLALAVLSYAIVGFGMFGHKGAFTETETIMYIATTVLATACLFLACLSIVGRMLDDKWERENR